MYTQISAAPVYLHPPPVPVPFSDDLFPTAPGAVPIPKDFPPSSQPKDHTLP